YGSEAGEGAAGLEQAPRAPDVDPPIGRLRDAGGQQPSGEGENDGRSPRGPAEGLPVEEAGRHRGRSERPPRGGRAVAPGAQEGAHFMAALPERPHEPPPHETGPPGDERETGHRQRTLFVVEATSQM